ncbi:MAG: hypothetical protein K0S91_330 [Nitrososphaeraceae archaeon]|jgi:hypothetical protein|nr:hypothetical protein [Nitrososphaeraceae archaeon]
MPIISIEISGGVTNVCKVKHFIVFNMLFTLRVLIRFDNIVETNVVPSNITFDISFIPTTFVH